MNAFGMKKETLTECEQLDEFDMGHRQTVSLFFILNSFLPSDTPAVWYDVLQTFSVFWHFMYGQKCTVYHFLPANEEHFRSCEKNIAR